MCDVGTIIAVTRPSSTQRRIASGARRTVNPGPVPAARTAPVEETPASVSGDQQINRLEQRLNALRRRGLAAGTFAGEQPGNAPLEQRTLLGS
jgi:hypothetical protein